MISLVRNSSNSLLGGSRFSRFIGRTLRERNFNKLLLTALLIGAVSSAMAQADYSTGLFSVSPTKQVYLAKTNLSTSASGFYTWDEAHALTGCELLTEDEWHFLLQSRCGGQKEAYELYALGRVEGTNGLVILPDAEVWHWPTEALRLAWNNYNTQHGYEKNTYTSEEWALMETNGAVFLPAAGYWTGSAVEDGNQHGAYWIDTEDEGNTTKAYRLQFDNNIVVEYETFPKTNYYSVRTVQTASAPIKLSEYDQPEVFAAKKDALSGETTVGIYRTLRKAGCFNTLTLPFNVPDIAASPLAGAEVYEFVGAAVVGDALQLDITPLVGNALTAGTPYLIQWSNTGEVLFDMTFTDITWDADNTADDAGANPVVFHGFYGRTHIDNDMDLESNHLNLFLGANNTLYWPTDGNDADAKMLGFRAWFQITNSGASLAPIYRGMPAALRIRSTATDMESVQHSEVGIQKELRNGQIIINRNGEKYSTTGQKL